MVFYSSQNVERSPMTGPARELARRLSGTDEIVLLWHPRNDRVEVSVRDVTTDATSHIEIAPRNALDAFTHPYAYISGYAALDRTNDEVVASVGG